MRTVTALRERPRGRVDVDLDGAPWRTLPADAVVGAGLLVGRSLDRETARSLARELRRARALAKATRALRHRDLSRQALAERLPAAGRDDAIETLERSGYLDDGRAAASRAEALASRGWGDEAIRLRLEQEGFAAEPLDGALAGLERESERARGFLAGGRTARWLAARGFDVEPAEVAPEP
ncbi:MAG: RecX family transcriptional regulator [Actinobacteria bacterium]|nr:RecX family transcriptional regulator [Actinomycetota bacterium]MBV8599571.1 RecX family transcriptional regulator [Actinomycetota bacterium]